MTVADKTLFVCNCNRTMPLDGAALGRALALPAAVPVHSALCQRELAQFADGARGDVLVACTQEQRLLGDVAEEGGRAQTIRFVNIRETGGWSAEAAAATPKIAALIAAAAMPDPEPVAAVGYQSAGQLLIVGPLDAALAWAGALAGRLAVTVLATGRTAGAVLPAERAFPVHSGRLTALTGWLGAFDAQWTQENPIDLDACTRCNACLRACPEHAIDESYQIDLDRCRSHRACVAACGQANAIDFARRDTARSERFDLVLDLHRTPWFRQHQPPQGYFGPGADPLAQAKAVTELAGMTGEFEKPKFFRYKASLCAHSRSKIVGCTQCIDVCSTAAIRADGDHVFVEPHLCAGCGACTTVCPSGALTFAYPAVPDLAARLKTLLATFGRAGGRDACLVFHAEDGRAALARVARRGRGGEAHDGGARARAPRRARAGAAADDPAAARLAVRDDRDRQRQVHAVHGVRRRVPGVRDPGQRRAAAGPVHRSELRPVRHLRHHVPRARDRALAAPQPRARGEGAARPQRGGGGRVHPVRQAPRHAEDGRDDAG